MQVQAQNPLTYSEPALNQPYLNHALVLFDAHHNGLEYNTGLGVKGDEEIASRPIQGRPNHLQPHPPY